MTQFLRFTSRLQPREITVNLEQIVAVHEDHNNAAIIELSSGTCLEVGEDFKTVNRALEVYLMRKALLQN